MANHNPRFVWSGTDAAVREQQKHDFGQNQDLVPSSPRKSTFTPKNFPFHLTLCVDSESVIRNMIVFRNLEITFKNGSYFYLTEAVFYSVGGEDMNKLTSEKESAHKI